MIQIKFSKRKFQKKVSNLFLVALVLSSFACTKSAPKNTGPQTVEKNISISTLGETMAFDKTEFFVKSGEEITVTFKNNASAMKHNWVLVAPGKADEVGMAAAKAGEALGFIPQSSDVIAASKLIDKGEHTFKFKAPAPGDYPFICTFPGHYTVMRGILHSI